MLQSNNSLIDDISKEVSMLKQFSIEIQKETQEHNDMLDEMVAICCSCLCCHHRTLTGHSMLVCAEQRDRVSARQTEGVAKDRVDYD